jgi:hypothetical protein
MDQNVAEALVRLCRDAANIAGPDIAVEAAKNTGGLPVQCDMGGVLLLTPLGEVLHYDPERKTAASVTDSKWRTAALVKAARKYPELAALHPARPNDAVVCTQCGGVGRMFGVADCGVCMGTGWLASVQ